jgi:hypothetical protein
MAKTTESPATGVTEDGLAWRDVPYNGTTYRIREITVDEGDTAYDAAYDEIKDRVNWRLHSRINLSTAIISPPTTVDDIKKWPGVKLVTLLREYDKLNLLRDADTAGN